MVLERGRFNVQDGTGTRFSGKISGLEMNL
jgi:hypothetical protein